MTLDLDQVLHKLARLNPPGLRVAPDRERFCGVCRYFVLQAGRQHQGEGDCTLRTEAVPVRYDFVCDAYEAEV